MAGALDAAHRKGIIHRDLKPGKISRNDRTSPAHGFSCLVRAGNETLLLDAGGDGEVLISNMATGGPDALEIDVVVATHCHGDHIGGLPSIMRADGRQVKLFLPFGEPSGDIAGRALTTVDSAAILEQRERTKQETMSRRRSDYRKAIAMRQSVS